MKVHGNDLGIKRTQESTTSSVLLGPRVSNLSNWDTIEYGGCCHAKGKSVRLHSMYELLQWTTETSWTPSGRSHRSGHKPKWAKSIPESSKH